MRPVARDLVQTCARHEHHRHARSLKDLEVLARTRVPLPFSHECALDGEATAQRLGCGSASFNIECRTLSGMGFPSTGASSPRRAGGSGGTRPLALARAAALCAMIAETGAPTAPLALIRLAPIRHGCPISPYRLNGAIMA